MTFNNWRIKIWPMLVDMLLKQGVHKQSHLRLIGLLNYKACWELNNY